MIIYSPLPYLTTVPVSPDNWTVESIAPFSFIVMMDHDKPIITIHRDGNVELGKDVKPDDASKCFWNWLQVEAGLTIKFHNVKGCFLQ